MNVLSLSIKRGFDPARVIAQVRAWREEDRRNGIIWNDETPEADGAGDRSPAPLASQQGQAA